MTAALAAAVGGVAPVLALSPSAAMPPAPTPGVPQYSGDWAAGCDNVLRCEAMGLLPDGAAAQDAVVILQVERAASPGGAVILRAKGFDFLPREVSLVADGREIARLTGAGNDEASLTGAPALVAAQAMANAVTLELRDPRGKKAEALIASPSSKGLAETFQFMDARQGRTGTLTALVARGTQADSDVPAAPTVPEVRQAISPDADSAASLTPSELAQARKLAVCDPSLQAAKVEELVSLDKHAALLLLPCQAGEYNVSAVPLVAMGVPGSRTLAIAKFDFAPGFTGEPGKPPLVVNPLWDARRGILSSLAKGRGGGDCGAAEDYVWDGAMFRLVESRAMHVCRGAWEWIRLWTAQARRG